MLEGPGHKQSAARLKRAFHNANSAKRRRRLPRWLARRGRDLGLVALGGAVGGSAMVLLDRVPAPRSNAAPVYYANCREAFLDGAVSIPRARPGYRPPLDADDDGIACEPYRGP